MLFPKESKEAEAPATPDNKRHCSLPLTVSVAAAARKQWKQAETPNMAKASSSFGIGAAEQRRLQARSLWPSNNAPAAPDKGSSYRIPPKPANPKVILDPMTVFALQQETESVSRLLEKIFAGNASEPFSSLEQTKMGRQMPADRHCPLLSLDRGHTHLLRALLSKPEWTRAEFVDLCSGLELMPDGALEHINDKSFQHFDEALIEGEETLVLNQDLIKEIRP